MWADASAGNNLRGTAADALPSYINRRCKTDYISTGAFLTYLPNTVIEAATVKLISTVSIMHGIDF